MASKTDAKALGTYRLLNSEYVNWEPIVAAHVQKTMERVVEAGPAIVAHDSTDFSFGGEVRREGLGRIHGGDQGFLAHTALAMSADGKRLPLGVLGFAPWVRPEKTRRKKANGKKKSGSDYAKETGKESDRWFEMVEKVSGQLKDMLVHVMDREADAYPLLVQLAQGGHRFVVRASKDRVVQAAEDGAPTERLNEALVRVESVDNFEVPVSRRAASTIPGKAKTFGARPARTATVEISAMHLRVQKPRYQKDVPKWLGLNVVHVREVDPPQGVQPVDWQLFTLEPVNTVENIMAVIEFYRARWLIEEFFKALKTGCSFEQKQHESLGALLIALAICLPIAWSMLLLRTVARSQPELPAIAVLNPVQIEVLQACSPKLVGPHPTVGDVLRCVASLGGHLKSNGEPGWLVLSRGMNYLLALEQGWVAARQKK